MEDSMSLFNAFPIRFLNGLHCNCLKQISIARYYIRKAINDLSAVSK